MIYVQILLKDTNCPTQILNYFLMQIKLFIYIYHTCTLEFSRIVLL